MRETFYEVRVLMNGRTNTSPTEFECVDDAIAFANKVRAMASDEVTIATHIYEVTEITY